MKKTIVLLLAISLLLCGCSELIPERTTMPTQGPMAAGETPSSVQLANVPETEATTEPETEPETEPPTTEPEPEPVYFNPLNGEILDAPFDKRIFAVSINNLREAVPHYNVNAADMYFESFVNGSIIRGLAMFTDPRGLTAIGPVRSNRLMFNDLVTHYDCVMVHAGGSWQVVEDCTARGIDNFNIDAWSVMETTSFRDMERNRAGYGWEHCLFAIGDGLVKYAAENGMRTEFDPSREYNLLFTEDATPENGMDAEEITVTITAHQYKKDTSMIYHPELGKYVYHQYEKDMVDGLTGEYEAFRNVMILTGNIYFDGPFQRINMIQGGEGWYACGGKAIPIRWGAFDETSPLWFATMDGEPLVISQGNTYVAITETGSNIVGIGQEV